MTFAAGPSAGDAVPPRGRPPAPRDWSASGAGAGRYRPGSQAVGGHGHAAKHALLPPAGPGGGSPPSANTRILCAHIMSTSVLKPAPSVPKAPSRPPPPPPTHTPHFSSPHWPPPPV